MGSQGQRGVCALWRGNQQSPGCTEVDWTKNFFTQQISGKKKGKEEGELFIEKDLRGLLLTSACCLRPHATLFLCCPLSDQEWRGRAVGAQAWGARPTGEVLVPWPTTRWGCRPAFSGGAGEARERPGWPGSLGWIRSRSQLWLPADPLQGARRRQPIDAHCHTMVLSPQPLSQNQYLLERWCPGSLGELLRWGLQPGPVGAALTFPRRRHVEAREGGAGRRRWGHPKPSSSPREVGRGDPGAAGFTSRSFPAILILKSFKLIETLKVCARVRVM